MFCVRAKEQGVSSGQVGGCGWAYDGGVGLRDDRAGCEASKGVDDVGESPRAELGDEGLARLALTVEKQLALASYGSPLSPDPAHAAAKRKAAEGAAQAPPAQPHEGGAPPKRPKPKGPKSPKATPKGSASKERAAK